MERQDSWPHSDVGTASSARQAADPPADNAPAAAAAAVADGKTVVTIRRVSISTTAEAEVVLVSKA